MKKLHDKLRSCLIIIRDIYGNILDIPHKHNILLNVEFMRLPTMAHASSGGKAKITKHIISLNKKYIDEYHDVYEREIIAHELAHIICFINQLDGDHGSTWSDICKSMGGSGLSKIDTGSIIK